MEEPQQILESVLYSNTNAELLRSTLDRPVYHPHYGKVMTDEQLEILRRQISVYATICQQLVEMHKATVASQSQLNGTTAGEPDQSTSSYKAAARQRWTPSQTQLQILERLFDLGIGTPNKQKVKEITAELSQHGSISESNVYNWFQNRKARSKRRQQQITHRDGDSEFDTDADSPKEKRQRQDSPSPYNDPDASQSVAESRPSETATSNAGTVLIFVNGKLCEVPAGIFNVKRSFGETKVLLNDQGQIIATNETGVILQPLRAGEKYTLAEVETKREPDNFSSLIAQIEAMTGGSEVFFAKRSMLPVHR